jgi:hypothetical protein
MPKKIKSKGSAEIYIAAVIIAIIVTILFWMNGIHIYSALTFGFIVLFTLSLFTGINKTKILPLLILWAVVFLWIFGYVICKSTTDFVREPIWRSI